jgi:hypothetical protein
MERRLNCYNYIFSSCQFSSNCPYGHVIIPNKDEYLRSYELNIDGVRDKTSPRGNFHIDLNNINETFNEYESNKKKRKGHHNMDNYTEMIYVNCTTCNSLKWEKRSYANYLKRRDEGYICKECQEKARSAGTNQRYECDDLRLPNRMNVYSL